MTMQFFTARKADWPEGALLKILVQRKNGVLFEFFLGAHELGALALAIQQIMQQALLAQHPPPERGWRQASPSASKDWRGQSAQDRSASQLGLLDVVEG